MMPLDDEVKQLAERSVILDYDDNFVVASITRLPRQAMPFFSAFVSNSDSNPLKYRGGHLTRDSPDPEA